MVTVFYHFERSTGKIEISAVSIKVKFLTVIQVVFQYLSSYYFFSNFVCKNDSRNFFPSVTKLNLSFVGSVRNGCLFYLSFQKHHVVLYLLCLLKICFASGVVSALGAFSSTGVITGVFSLMSSIASVAAFFSPPFC